MSSVFDMFKQELTGEVAEATAITQEHKLAELTELIDSKLKMEKEVAELTIKLTEANKKLDKINSEVIPDKMMELGLAKVTTDSGAEVSVGKIYRGNISATNAPFVIDWFKATNQADSIKNKFEVSLGVGDAEKAEQLKLILMTAGFNYNNKSEIAWNTLASIIKNLELSENLTSNKAWDKLQEDNKVPKNLSLKDALGVFSKYETKLKFKK